MGRGFKSRQGKPGSQEKEEIKIPKRLIITQEAKEAMKESGNGYSAKQRKQVLETLILCGGNIYEVCKATGINRRTIYNWIDKYPEFKEGVEDIREIIIDNVETSLYKNATEKNNVIAQIFFLKTQAKHRGYVETKDTTNVNIDAIKIKYIVPPQPTINLPNIPQDNIISIDPPKEDQSF